MTISKSGKGRKRDHPPSNARKRRAAHLSRAAEVRERKRLRALRAEIHRAMEAAAEMVESSKGSILAPKPYRALDKKDDSGWQIADANGTVVDHDTSRDKARAKAKMMTKNPEAFYSSPPITREEAMLELGWRAATAEEIEEYRRANPRARSLPVEAKIVRASS